ncbi:CDP-6-deoxy-delta-3,4-glucoseen reductase [Pelistega europaea]|uniref:CDP-6-deoxy-delta-3,4-glucoseen reductase n=1 Tax=Pelistega europaea TaxID=106147 RepID=A0A7Y4LDL9_9BURK|nr:CDP-6-deoxy-delta-3,4-glucoseen reductase [Pelistega europaea]NOL50291.1 CDP-6-deoxy-delta-3,4-glucoseen reductase [Pelistega europaea]
MAYQVTIESSNHTFTVKEGQTILDAALEQDIVLPYSCRTGSCTSCKGKVVSGEYEAGPGTATLVSDEEKAQGACLFCETKPLSDLVIQAREVRLASDIQVKKMPVRVSEMTQLADDVMKVVLQTPGSEKFIYEPGQYVEFILKDGSRRAYSLATRTAENNMIELHIRHMPGGLFTDYVFGAGNTAMKVREILRLEGPLGSFFLRKDSDKPTVLLASGTGFAPLKAIMEEVIAVGMPQSITLYWGGRRPADIYMMDLCREWEATLPNFKFVPVVSNALPEDNWTGRTGFVHAAVLEDIPDLSDYQVYACGAPIVVSSAREAYTKAGLPADEFYADSFTSAADAVK